MQTLILASTLALSLVFALGAAEIVLSLVLWLAAKGVQQSAAHGPFGSSTHPVPVAAGRDAELLVRDRAARILVQARRSVAPHAEPRQVAEVAVPPAAVHVRGFRKPRRSR